MLMGERGLYWKLTGRENLDFFGALYHIPGELRRQQIEQIIELLNLGDIIDRTVETYSSGQKMKLAFAKALINQAPLLVLDEPTNTLDVPSARELRAIVRDLNGQGHTVIYTTHQMAEAEELCDRVAIMDQGKIIALGATGELRASLQQETVICVEGVIPAPALAAEGPGARRRGGIGGCGRTRRAAGGLAIPGCCPRVDSHPLPNGAVLRTLPAQVTLEDVFVADGETRT
jgi:ABC-2 type transport system ATP-binding protein